MRFLPALLVMFALPVAAGAAELLVQRNDCGRNPTSWCRVVA